MMSLLTELVILVERKNYNYAALLALGWSLRWGLIWLGCRPGVETPGYSEPSLRDWRLAV